MRQALYNVRLALAVLLPLLLAMAPAMAQTVVYEGETSSLTVVQVPGDTYQWELYNDGTVDFATTSGNCPVTSAQFVAGNIGSSVIVKWLKAGTYFFKVTASNGSDCTNNLKIGIILVKAALPRAVISPPDPICTGSAATLSVNMTGTGPWDVTFTDGLKTWTVTTIINSPYSLIVSPKTTTSYWVTQVKDRNAINTIPSDPVKLQVNPKPASSRIYLYQP